MSNAPVWGIFWLLMLVFCWVWIPLLIIAIMLGVAFVESFWPWILGLAVLCIGFKVLVTYFSWDWLIEKPAVVADKNEDLSS